MYKWPPGRTHPEPKQQENVRLPFAGVVQRLPTRLEREQVVCLDPAPRCVIINEPPSGRRSVCIASLKPRCGLLAFRLVAVER